VLRNGSELLVEGGDLPKDSQAGLCPSEGCGGTIEPCSCSHALRGNTVERASLPGGIQKQEQSALSAMKQATTKATHMPPTIKPVTPKKILIVDDDILNTVTMTQILLQNGYEVSHARDKDHAIKVAQKFRPDMIICDAENKEVDALQFLKLVRQAPQTHRAAVLVLTGRREMFAGEPGLLGPRQFLMKPFTREQLAIAVQENLKHSRSKPK
jgi:PleD family two-component response regulator